MKKMMFLLVFCMLWFNTMQNIYAKSDDGKSEVGIECVGDYSTWNDLNDLNSPIDIANDLATAFKKGNAKDWYIKYCFRNNAVDEKDFRGKSLGGNDDIFADSVDLLFYSGHGLKPKKHGASDYSFALNTKRASKYAEQREMYLGNGDLEWLVTFTCNFLNGSMDQIGHMAKGIHTICGYSTTVVLTPNMGRVMAKKLKNGVSVKNAFIATSIETVPWNDIYMRKAAVFTTKSCADDKIYGYGKSAKDPEAYSKNKNIYVKYIYSF